MIVGRDAAPAGVGQRTSRARAVTGLRSQALGPAARSWLTVRSPSAVRGLNGTAARKGPCPRAKEGSPAAGSAARLPEDAAMARQEAPHLQR